MARSRFPDVPRATCELMYNYRDTDWEKFNKTLKTHLAKLSPVQPLVTDDEFQTSARDITKAIQSTIEETIPRSRPNPHSKRWWTKDLTIMRREVAKLSHLSYRTRDIPNHPSHEEHRIKRNEYTEAINKPKSNTGRTGSTKYQGTIYR